jgi:hypothetical protein
MASVQGFLPTKTDPRAAVRDIPSWIVEERVITVFGVGDGFRGPNIANIADVTEADSCADDCSSRHTLTVRPSSPEEI